MIFRYLTFLLLILAATWATPSAGQCEPQWLPGDSAPRFFGSGSPLFASTLWDPDGSGPSPQLLVIGGTASGSGTGTGSVGVYNPSTRQWGTLGTGLVTQVSALAVLADGRLVAGGEAGLVQGYPKSLVAVWDGTEWKSLGLDSHGGYCHDLATLPDGTLVAVGFFEVGEYPSGGYSVAAWNGDTWRHLGDAFPYPAKYDPDTPEPPIVRCVTVLKNGDVVIGGSFLGVGGIDAAVFARWDGAKWNSLGFPNLTSGLSARAIFETSTGDLFVGLWRSQRNDLLYRWDGSSWTVPFATRGQSVDAIAELPNGDIVVGGRIDRVAFPVAGPLATVANIVRWNGTSVSPLAEGVDNTVTSLRLLPGGTLAVIGGFNTAGTEKSPNVALWDNGIWRRPSPGFDAAIHAIAVRPDGTAIAGGVFTRAGDARADRVAQWNGREWSPMGAGLNGTVNALASLPNGDVIAGGSFAASGATSMKSVARWNGAMWSPVGNSLPVTINALAVHPNGMFTAAGYGINNEPARVYQWNGSLWWTLGTGMTGGTVLTLLALPNGHIVAGGTFTAADSTPAFGIALWNHTKWTPLGSGMLRDGNPGSVSDLILEPDGTILAAGHFTTAGGVPANGIARWNGNSWQTVGSSPSYYTNAIALLPDGRIISDASGLLWSWNGAEWISFADPTDGGVEDFAVGPDGTLFAVGSFFSIGGQRNAHFARLGVDPACCPADLDRDDLVSSADFVIFADAYNLLLCADPLMPAACPADLDRSTRVDDDDFMLFVRAYDDGLCP
jgi:hypothetical protein